MKKATLWRYAGESRWRVKKFFSQLSRIRINAAQYTRAWRISSPSLPPPCQQPSLCRLLTELAGEWPALKALTNTIQEEEEHETEKGMVGGIFFPHTIVPILPVSYLTHFFRTEQSDFASSPNARNRFLTTLSCSPFFCPPFLPGYRYSARRLLRSRPGAHLWRWSHLSRHEFTREIVQEIWATRLNKLK